MPPIEIIFSSALNQRYLSSREITGLGSVNRVFELEGELDSYMLRLNQDADKWLEYKKEAWCLEQTAVLGIPGPKVLGMGQYEDWVWMIQEKLPGLNGKLCPEADQPRIWRQLGSYAAVFQQIDTVDDSEVKRNLLHRDWVSRLRYNLGELSPQDSLLRQGIFTQKEQDVAIASLKRLEACNFTSGLVHGDLCPRNVLVDGETIYLLDWGTAEINVVPVNELGLLLISEEAGPQEMEWYLEGYGMTEREFSQIKTEIMLLNFMDRLDKYRWAEAHAPEVIERYIAGLKKAYALGVETPS